MLYQLAWATLFVGWSYVTLPRLGSDHAFLVSKYVRVPKPRNCPFRFLNCWLKHPSFIQLVLDSWSQEVHGPPLSRLMKKLHNLKLALKVWNMVVFGNIDAQINVAQEQLLVTASLEYFRLL